MNEADERSLIVVGVDGALTVTPLDQPPDHHQLHDAVQGFIELIPWFTSYQGRPCVAFCNEEGKLEGLPFNRAANLLWAEALGYPPTNDVLVGPIAIVAGPQSFLDRL